MSQSSVEVVLQDDEFGLDLLIDARHNVNIGWEPTPLSVATHISRDGKHMQVQFHPVLYTYYVIVGA